MSSAWQLEINQRKFMDDLIHKNNLFNKFKKTSIICSVLVGLISIGVLFCWILDAISMKPNTAITFILTSLALIFLQFNLIPFTRIARVFAFLILIIGLLTFIEYTFDYDLHIDQLMCQTLVYFPGGMSPATSIVFILLGISLFFINSAFNPVIFQFLASSFGLFGLMVLTGYSFQFTIHYQIIPYIYTPIYAGFNFILIAIAILFIKPNQGFIRALTNDSMSGHFARILIPVSIIIPLLLVYLSVWGESVGFFNSITAVLLLLVSFIAVELICIYSALYILMNSDLKRKLIEDDLKRSNQELQQFAYIASHDLQEPLRMISSYLELLERRYVDKLDQNANDFIHFATDGAHRMRVLIKGLLAFSRVTTKGKEFAPVDCNIILKDVLANLRKLIDDKNVIMTYDKLPIVQADEFQLEQVFQNLIMNAIKFSDKKPAIHIGVKEDLQEWIFSVKDNGIGISNEYFETIFYIFKRLNPQEKYSGSGMGLAICKRIIERHYGKMWVTSELGKGSIFYFSIPK